MQEIINALYCSTVCIQQETLSVLQASYIKGACSRVNVIAQRECIVDWLQCKGCDIEMDGQFDYVFNGCKYPWIETSELELWARNEGIL